jgi:hypothetical protein
MFKLKIIGLMEKESDGLMKNQNKFEFKINSFYDIYEFIYLTN